MRQSGSSGPRSPPRFRLALLACRRHERVLLGEATGAMCRPARRQPWLADRKVSLAEKIGRMM